MYQLPANSSSFHFLGRNPFPRKKKKISALAKIAFFPFSLVTNGSEQESSLCFNFLTQGDFLETDKRKQKEIISFNLLLLQTNTLPA